MVSGGPLSRLRVLLPHRAGARGGPHGESGGLFAPGPVEVAARHLSVGAGWIGCFAVTGYPRQVHPGWLAPLLDYPGRLDVSLHIDPVDPTTANTRLRRQLARFESARRHGAEHGALPDPYIEAAAEDAYDLSERVARGEGRLFRVGLYLCVHAQDETSLGAETAAVRALAASLLLDASPTTWRQLAGWTACLPLSIDPVRQRRVMDTDATAAAFPFTSPDLPATDPVSTTPAGVLYGYNLGSHSLLHWDRFAAHNHNAVVLGRSGSGKSYLVKTELLRWLYRGVQGWVIDPENEYTRLAGHVGATVIALGAPGVRLNPFDLPIHTRPDGHRSIHRDALTRRQLFLHTAIAVLLGDLTATQRATLDTAITATYRAAGITTDPTTWTRPAPTLPDLVDTLTHTSAPGGAVAGSTGAEAAELAAQLRPHTHGAFAGPFSGPTTTHPDGHLVVFTLRGLPEELKPLATLLTLDTIWRHVTNPADPRPRLVVVDEAWLLMAQPAGARFLWRLSKSARKHWAGLTVATQDTPDLLGSDLGRAVITNAATQILMRQAPQAIDQISELFDLTDGERAFLLRAEQGQALLVAGAHRAALHTLASPVEHTLADTTPTDQPRPGDRSHSGLVDTADGESDYIDLDDPTVTG